MKNTLLLIACFFLTIGAQAQEDQDTTRISLGNLKLIIVDDSDSTKVATEDPEDDGEPSKSELTFWAGIDLGVNVLMDKNQNTSFSGDDEWLNTDPSRSLSCSFNIFEEKIRLVKDYVGITTGLGITYNSYGLNDDVRLISNSDSTFGFLADREAPDSLGGFTSFSKNKLRTTYLRVPLLLEFNTSRDPDRTFHVAGGVIGGLRIGSINKVKYEEDGKKVKQRTKDDFNFSPFTLDATVRVGYKNYTLFANYGLTPLFEDGKGPEVYPVTVGLTVVPW